MQAILTTSIGLVLLVILILSMIELFKPENKKKRNHINYSFRESRRQSELISMPDGTYFSKN